MPAGTPVAILALTSALLSASPARGDLLRPTGGLVVAEVAGGWLDDEVLGAGPAPEPEPPDERIDGHVPEDSSSVAAADRWRARKPAWLWPLAFGVLVIAGLAALRLCRRPGPPT